MLVCGHIDNMVWVIFSSQFVCSFVCGSPARIEGNLVVEMGKMSYGLGGAQHTHTPQDRCGAMMMRITYGSPTPSRAKRNYMWYHPCLQCQ